MKKLLVCIGLLLACTFGTQAWATTLSFNPWVSSIALGESLDVDVLVAGLGSGIDVGAFDFNICFDNTKLDFNSYTLTDNLGDISMLDADDYSLGDLGGGKVNLSALSWLWDLSFQPDSFTLATLSFTGIGAGPSWLGFEFFGSPYYLSDAMGEKIHTLPIFGKVDITQPVPEPGTILLLGTGMAGLFGFRMRRKKVA